MPKSAVFTVVAIQRILTVLSQDQDLQDSRLAKVKHLLMLSIVQTKVNHPTETILPERPSHSLVSKNFYQIETTEMSLLPFLSARLTPFLLE